MSILSITLQIMDQMFSFPTGFDIIASCIEDWWESYKFIQRLKIVG